MLSNRMRYGVLLAALVAAGCSAEESSRGGVGPCVEHADGSAACAVETDEPASEGADHVADCAKVSYKSNPPSSGPHYFTWGAFGSYQEPLPRGFWVHAMEHGAVVFSYHGKKGCEDDVAAAEALVSELVDPGCASDAGGSSVRVILTPDPLLDTQWAASAWGQTLRAQCFDRDAFKNFFDEHVGHGPEQVCVPGQDFRNADGTLDLPPGCDSTP
jgi:hypothetical protein